ncbi:MAG: hypothetical protein CM15mV33_340 [uncultured marine virus]|nr:MAG: hypothetical protein CM15mV33_340 [uncultured marine virus]
MGEDLKCFDPHYGYVDVVDTEAWGEGPGLSLPNEGGVPLGSWVFLTVRLSTGSWAGLMALAGNC